MLSANWPDGLPRLCFYFDAVELPAVVSDYVTSRDGKQRRRQRLLTDVERAIGKVGHPYLPRKNTHHRNVKGRTGRHLTPAAIAFRNLVRRAWVSHRPRIPQLADGHWSLELLVFTPRRHENGMPWLDSDACVEPVRDALEFAGVVDNDHRIVRGEQHVAYSPLGRAIAFSLWPLRDYASHVANVAARISASKHPHNPTGDYREIVERLEAAAMVESARDLLSRLDAG